MSEKEIAEAIAQQEEYLKRIRTCSAGRFLPHAWETYSTAPGGPKYQACWRCKVTKTDEDYQIKQKAKRVK